MATLASLQGSSLALGPAKDVLGGSGRTSVQCRSRGSRCVKKLLVRASAGREKVVTRAKAEGATDEVVDARIGQYCDVTKQKKTLGEMEQDFLLALQAFYIDAKPVMSNEEFDNLKEELQWQGSNVVMLSADEQKFMQASMAFADGKPFMSDEDYEQLKTKLKESGSKLAIQGPRCSIRTKRVFSDSRVDYLRMTALNLPAALVSLGLVFFLDDLTGFEITYLLELPEPWSFIWTWFVVLPVVYLVARGLTNFVLRDFLILTGPCPSCGANNVSFFGEILTVNNPSRANDVKCESCGANLKFDLDSRRITLEPATPKPPPKKAPAAKSA